MHIISRSVKKHCIWCDEYLLWILFFFFAFCLNCTYRLKKIINRWLSVDIFLWFHFIDWEWILIIFVCLFVYYPQKKERKEEKWEIKLLLFVLVFTEIRDNYFLRLSRRWTANLNREAKFTCRKQSEGEDLLVLDKLQLCRYLPFQAVWEFHRRWYVFRRKEIFERQTKSYFVWSFQYLIYLNVATPTPCRSAYDFFNLPMLVVILTLKWTSPGKRKLFGKSYDFERNLYYYPVRQREVWYILLAYFRLSWWAKFGISIINSSRLNWTIEHP